MTFVLELEREWTSRTVPLSFDQFLLLNRLNERVTFVEDSEIWNDCFDRSIQHEKLEDEREVPEAMFLNWPEYRQT